MQFETLAKLIQLPGLAMRFSLDHRRLGMIEDCLTAIESI